jgi:hypothetical protein
MLLDGEMLPDRAKAREKSLSAFRRSKSTHATLAFTRRLMAIFRAIIHSCGGFHKHMLNVRQLGDLRLRGGITAKLVCHDLAWYFAARGEYAFAEANQLHATTGMVRRAASRTGK